MSRVDGELRVWGIARTIPRYCCVIEVAEPGLLVVKHHRGETLAKFVNVAVLQGDQVKVVDEHASSLPDCPSLLTSLLGFDSPASWAGSVNVHGAAGGLDARAPARRRCCWWCPAGTDAWRDSVVQPMSYAVSPAVHGAGDPQSRTVRSDARARLARRARSLGRRDRRPDRDRRRDGRSPADYELLTFGAKIARRKGSPQVDQLTVTEPIEGRRGRVVNPAQLGGTRHLSAAQFVHDQRDALALVASQDGRFTVFAWSPCEGMVHAHRVETLLL